MKRVLRTALSICAAATIAGAASAQEARRELGPHVHGSGKLEIAIEGDRVSLDLDTPAHDIIGFEHAPQTPEQTKVLDAAVAKLKDAASVFRMTPDANCKLEKAEAGLEKPEAGESTGTAEPEAHADFNGTFVFACGAIGKLKAIDLGYFAAFPEAAKLDITIISPKGQTTRQATREAPRIDLGGLI